MKIKKALLFCAVCLSIFGFKTFLDIKPVTNSFHSIVSDASNTRITDRTGKPLAISYQNNWNSYDNLPLHEIPKFLQQAFVISEDKRFFEHGGVDWKARGSAVIQNIKGLQALRGASTITEQVVRMINPRPRNLWSKWIETFEANILEGTYNKNSILEFYLNQVPYASNRRGIAQAAKYYFNRDLDTLTKKEMLALVILARAPSSYDLYKDPKKIEPLIAKLAQKLGVEIDSQELKLEAPELPVNASHFVSYLRKQPVNFSGNLIHTTIDSSLQSKFQSILDERLHTLTEKDVHNAAILVVDHKTNEIISWVVATPTDKDLKAAQIDAVTTPRQPGSSLKPFLYTHALELRQTPITIIEDSPMSEAVGTGLHKFNNYSNIFYGNITLREALGNSLNIPAVKTIQFVGVKNYLDKLHDLGFSSLSKDYKIYNEGLALGNGEVTLFEMVQAYSALANGGKFRPLSYLLNGYERKQEKQIFSAEAASLISNILSDPWARRLEFGSGSVLNLPVQTAVKTGTSTDYRDSWSIGYNDKYVVGIWMGNLDGKPTNGITGSTGPALVLRSVFAELNKNRETKPLYLSPKLVRKDVCIDYGNNSPCYNKTEFFIAGTENQTASTQIKKQPENVRIVRPTEGLQIAYDPRIPAEKQAFKFYIEGAKPGDEIDWFINDDKIATTTSNEYLWPVTRGKYQLEVNVRNPQTTMTTERVRFVVK